MEMAERHSARIVCELESDYPALLKLTPDRPFFLYILGHLAQRQSKTVAVIGTRNPTNHGGIIAERLTSFLVEDGWSIVSGLALGCDAIAHKTALAKGGHTIAVLAHGLQTIAPAQHERLSQEIVAKGGALVTEYGFGIKPYPPQFVKRDRIQAGLAQGVVMIQSDLDGGSLHASRASIEYKRFLAVPKPTDRDVSNYEKQIQTNLILCGSDCSAKMNLLKCNSSALDRVIVVNDKDDYPQLCNKLLEPWTNLNLPKNLNLSKQGKLPV